MQHDDWQVIEGTLNVGGTCPNSVVLGDLGIAGGVCDWAPDDSTSLAGIPSALSCMRTGSAWLLIKGPEI